MPFEPYKDQVSLPLGEIVREFAPEIRRVGALLAAIEQITGDELLGLGVKGTSNFLAYLMIVGGADGVLPRWEIDELNRRLFGIANRDAAETVTAVSEFLRGLNQ